MSFPTTPRYFLTFRNSDTGLTPMFTYFKRSDTLADVIPPSVVELSNGRYYFDWTFALSTSPDIVFQIDGGVSIPTEEVRYLNGQISPRDRFIDVPVSQVTTDIGVTLTSMTAQLTRALGLMHENSVLDGTTFTVDNNLLTGRMRIYDSKANADAAVAISPAVYNTGKIAEYAILATYVGTNLQTYKVSREA